MAVRHRIRLLYLLVTGLCAMLLVRMANFPTESLSSYQNMRYLYRVPAETSTASRETELAVNSSERESEASLHVAGENKDSSVNDSLHSARNILSKANDHSTEETASLLNKREAFVHSNPSKDVEAVHSNPSKDVKTANALRSYFKNHTKIVNGLALLSIPNPSAGEAIMKPSAQLPDKTKTKAYPLPSNGETSSLESQPESNDNLSPAELHVRRREVARLQAEMVRHQQEMNQQEKNDRVAALKEQWLARHQQQEMNQQEKNDRVAALKEQWLARRQPGHPYAVPHYQASVPKGPQLPPLPAPESNETPAAILHDLQQCSRTLGISEDKLAMTEVSKNASLYLSAVRSIIPTTFKPDLANFCWTSNFSFTTLYRVRKNFRYPELWSVNRKRPVKITATLIDHYSYQVTSQLKHPVENGHILCLPSFYLAGFPKCATTTMSDVLNKHNQIFPPKDGKEPHWLTRYNLLFSMSPNNTMFQDHATLSALRYALNFMPTPGDVRSITYDGSQSTLWDMSLFHSASHTDFCALPVILKRMVPEAKFVVLMRNPVTRVYSDFLWGCEEKYKNISKWPAPMRYNAPSLFHTLFVPATKQFDACLHKSSAFECYSHTNQKEECGELSMNRIAIGLYYLHIQKWLQVFPIEQFLFLRMEDFSADPSTTMKQVTDFLGLSEFTAQQKQSLFRKKSNVNEQVRDAHRFEMRADTRKLVTDFFQPYNEKLAELLGDTRFLWKD